MLLKDKVALITGAASGIGRATALPVDGGLQAGRSFNSDYR